MISLKFEELRAAGSWRVEKNDTEKLWMFTALLFRGVQNDKMMIKHSEHHCFHGNTFNSVL